MMEANSKALFLGLAIGDALGAPVEFKDRDSFPWVKDYAPIPHWSLLPGQWTDDTIMSICLADSLIRKNGYDSTDVMDEYFQWWWNGKNTPHQTCFDIGFQTGEIMERYRRSRTYGKVTLPPKSKAAGNGCIMRLAPVVIAGSKGSLEEYIHLLEASCRDTHNSDQALEATVIFGLILKALLDGKSKVESLEFAKDNAFDSFSLIPFLKTGESLPRWKVPSDGYVRHSLQAAWWAFTNTDSFEDCLEWAVNLGDDADTVGAIAGQLAGAFYGESAIPKRWLAELWQRERLESLAEGLEQVPPVILSTFDPAGKRSVSR